METQCKNGKNCRYLSSGGGCHFCHCTDDSLLYIVQAIRSFKVSDQYDSNMAIQLNNRAKKIVLEPPTQNIEFSRIATLFNDSHTIENHRDVGIQLKKISEKCYVWLRSGTKYATTWYHPHHSLAIAGLRTRDVVFSTSSDDSAASSVKEGFCKFFPNTEFREAVGRWYLCDFEIKPSLLGYELILPIPESIELLCQQCLRLSISEPIVTENNEFYVCHDCYKDLEE